MKINFFCFLTFWLFSIQLMSAQRDTLFVYEEEVVYDTIVVYEVVYTPSLRSLKRDNVELIQTDWNEVKEKIFRNKSATLWENAIILNENFNSNIKKSDSMKKISFISALFFTVQTLVAQTNYEISLGGGVWWQSGKLEYVEKPVSSLWGIGFFARRDIVDNHLALKTGIEYSYLYGGRDYKLDGTIGVWHSESGIELEDLNEIYGAGLHSFSIPFLFYYSRYSIEPFVGVNYNSLTSGSQTTTHGSSVVSQSHNLGVNLGAGTKLADKFYLNLELKHNLTSDYKADVGYVGSSYAGESVLGKSFSLTNSQLKMSLSYHF